MNVQVNTLAVVLAGLSSMVVGTLWYGPLFGKPWQKMLKLDNKKSKKEMPVVMGSTVVLSLVMAYVLAHVSFISSGFFGTSFESACLTTAFWLWLGMIVPAILTGGLFEQRRKKLMFLNIGNQLVTLLVMALIIGAFGIS